MGIKFFHTCEFHNILKKEIIKNTKLENYFIVVILANLINELSICCMTGNKLKKNIYYDFKQYFNQYSGILNKTLLDYKINITD